MLNVPEETVCRVCARVFCCQNCRLGHEQLQHADELANIATTTGVGVRTRGAVLANLGYYDLCAICQNQPFALEGYTPPDLLQHIQDEHMPLACEKCGQLYNTFEDLATFTKCVPKQQAVPTEPAEKTEHVCYKLKPSSSSAVTIATQTSPCLQPASATEYEHKASPANADQINLLRKLKSEGFFAEAIGAGDGSSLLRNISSINCSSVLQTHASLVPSIAVSVRRTTSTPLQVYAVCNQSKDAPAFGLSAERISSSTHNDNTSAVVTTATATPNVPKPEQGILKHRTTRVAQLTPLRQVMNKSIKKAIAEQKRCRNKVKFLADDDSVKGPLTVAGNSPIDLRITPVKRRQNQPAGRIDHKAELVIERCEKRQAIESVVVTCTSTQRIERKTSVERALVTGEPGGAATSTTALDASASSIYKTCESIEFFSTTTQMETQKTAGDHQATNNKHDLCQPHIAYRSARMMDGTPITCGLPSAQLPKKAISFETPALATPAQPPPPKKDARLAVELKATKLNVVDDSEDDKFYTPIKSSPKTKLHGYHEKQRRLEMNRTPNNAYKCPINRNLLAAASRPPLSQYMQRIASPSRNDDEAPKVTKSRPRRPTAGDSLWSMVKSIAVGLPMFKRRKFDDNDDDVSKENARPTKAQLKRSATTVGCSPGGQGPNPKRKRNNSLDFEAIKYYNSDDRETPRPPKRFRIHGRKPINRLRLDG